MSIPPTNYRIIFKKEMFALYHHQPVINDIII
jgi:hypothetical protein